MPSWWRGKRIKIFAVKDPAELDWSSLGAQVVVESTGKIHRQEGRCPNTCEAR